MNDEAYLKVYRAVSDAVIDVLKDYPGEKAALPMSAVTAYLANMVIYSGTDEEQFLAAFRTVLSKLKLVKDPLPQYQKVDPSELN